MNPSTTMTETCPHCEMECVLLTYEDIPNDPDYISGRMCEECSVALNERGCAECGCAFNPKDTHTIRMCETCTRATEGILPFECRECGVKGVYDPADGLSKEMLCDECREDEEEGTCVYCGAEAWCSCWKCDNAGPGDGGRMCRACAEEHGREDEDGEWLCGGCAEDDGYEDCEWCGHTHHYEDKCPAPEEEA